MARSSPSAAPRPGKSAFPRHRRLRVDPVLRKMNYKAGPIAVLGAPDELRALIGAWSRDYPLTEEPGGSARIAAPSFLLVFAASRAKFDELLPGLAPKVGQGIVFWVAFPKQSSPRYDSDLNRDIVWKLMEPLGFKPARNVALDEDWSALRFVPADRDRSRA